MTCQQPATGAQTSHFYALETDCGVTPPTAAFKPLRFTSGNLQLTKDSLQSAELDGSRNIADLRLGSNQTTGDISVELSITSYDDLIEAALGGTWTAGASDSGLTIDVDATLKTFTRSAGDYVADGVEVGNLIRFPGLTADNANYFIVTNVSPLVVTCANAQGLADEIGGTSDYSTGDSVGVGGTRRSFSVLTHFADADGGAGEWHITRGVEMSGFSFDVSVNALVTGTLNTIGRSYEADIALGGGWTFPAVTKTEPYASVDGRIIENDVLIGFVTSTSLTLDNAASAQFEIGSNDTSFIEQGRANNTLSLATFFENSTLLTKFINETETSIVVVLEGTDGALSFTYPRVVYTTGAPDVAGEGSISQALDAQALAGVNGESAIIVQRLTA